MQKLDTNMSTMKVLLAKLEIKEGSSEFSIRSIVINQSDIDVAAKASFSIKMSMLELDIFETGRRSQSQREPVRSSLPGSLVKLCSLSL